MATDVPNVPPSVGPEGPAPNLRQTRSHGKLKEARDTLLGGAKVAKPKSSKLKPSSQKNTQKQGVPSTHGVTLGPRPPDTPEATPEPEAARLQADQERRQTQVVGSSGLQTVASSLTPAAIGTPHNGAAETAGTSAGPSSSQSQVTYPDLSTQTPVANLTPAAIEAPHNGAAETAGTSAGPSSQPKVNEGPPLTEHFLDSDGNGNEETYEPVPDVDSEDEMKDDEPAPMPNDARIEIWKEADSYLKELLMDPDSTRVVAKLEEANAAIIRLNIEDNYASKNQHLYTIQIEEFQKYVKQAKPYLTRLIADETDIVARKECNEAHRMLDALRERHSYPNEWNIKIPPEPVPAPQLGGDSAAPPEPVPAPQLGGDSAAPPEPVPAPQPGGVPAVADLPDDKFKGGVKSQVHVRIPDMSDGRTPFGMVIHVRRAGSYGYRVIVNRGTMDHPYLEIYPGATFGKGIAKMWFESGLYRMSELPKDSNLPEAAFEARVRVKRGESRQLTPRQTRARKAMPPDSKPAEWEDWLHEAVTFYIIKHRVTRELFIASAVALRSTKGFSLAILEQKDLEVEQAMKINHAEILDFLQNNRHPDTGEKLTDDDFESMPWLTRRQE